MHALFFFFFSQLDCSYICFVTQSGGSWQIKRAKGTRFSRADEDEGAGGGRKLIEKWVCVCMGEGGNLIKQADRRRKQEWWGDRLMPTPPGMAFNLPD